MAYIAGVRQITIAEALNSTPVVTLLALAELEAAKYPEPKKNGTDNNKGWKKGKRK